MLKELSKNTPENHEDYQNIKNALEKIQNEVDGINNNKAGSDNLKKLVEISTSIDGLKVPSSKIDLLTICKR
jgi:hypothetical protein